MVNLVHSLAESKVFGPLVRFATTPAQTWETVLSQSRVLGQGSIFSWLPRQDRFSPKAMPPAILIGVMLLMVVVLGSLTLFDTEVIGGLTWLALVSITLLRIKQGLSWHFSVNSIDILVGMFLLSAGVSAACSSVQPTSWIGLAKFLTFFAGYALFRQISSCFADQNLPGSNAPCALSRWVLLIMGILALLGLGESLLGFYQYINHIQPLATWEDPSVNPELRMTRIFGSLKPSNPNLLAGFLIPCWAASLGLCAHTTLQKKWSISLVSGAVALAIMLALLMTGSRGAYLALATMGLTLFAAIGHLLWHRETLKQHVKWRVAWMLSILLVVLGLGALILVSPVLQHRVASMFIGQQDSSSAYRLNVYASAWRMFQDNWLLGIGPGNQTFKLTYGLYMVPGFNALSAYSVPLEIAVEQGVPGLLIFTSLVIVLQLRAWLTLDRETVSLQKVVLVAFILAGINGMLVFGLFDTIWYRPAINLLFWLWVGWLALLSEPPQPSLEKES